MPSNDLATVWVLIPVQVPGGEDLDITGYVNNFISIGLTDLQESVDDPNIDSSEDDELVVKKCVFGEAKMEQKF